ILPDTFSFVLRPQRTTLKGHQEHTKEHTKMPRGGPRPGAGAPKGNQNALKTGRYSQNHRRAVMIIAAVPELRQYLVALLRAYRRDQMKAIDNDISLSLAALAQSPRLRRIIKDYVSQHVRNASPRLQNLYFDNRTFEKTTRQSKGLLMEDLED